MPKEKSAGAIIYRIEPPPPGVTASQRNGVRYYLLLHYTPSNEGKRGQWGFAKGHVEQNETEIETAKREIQEETGLTDLKFINGFKRLEKYFFKKSYGLEGDAKKNAPWVFKLVVFFSCGNKN